MTTEIKKLLLSFTDTFVDNSYLDLYCELIKKNTATKRKKFSTQKHHVIPVALYKLLYGAMNRTQAISYANSDTNNFIVHLSYLDHILAHYYLSLCTSGNLKKDMTFAVNYIMKSIKFKDTKYDINQLVPLFADMYEQIMNEKKLSKLKHITDGINEYILPFNEAQVFIEENANWYFGRPRWSDLSRQKLSKSKAGQVHLNNGITWVSVDKNKVDSYITEGWTYGEVKPTGFVPWMKGKKHSEETKCKIRANRKDTHGINHPMYGKHHTVETKEKISKIKKGTTAWNKGKKMPETMKQKLGKPVICIELNKNFTSAWEALIWIKKENAKCGQQSKILEVCNGKRKTAYGYHWQLVPKKDI